VVEEHLVKIILPFFKQKLRNKDAEVGAEGNHSEFHSVVDWLDEGSSFRDVFP